MSTIADVNYTTTLVVVSCWSCGIVFGLPAGYITARRSDHKAFFCPNGHSGAFSGPDAIERERDQLKSEAESLRRRVEALRQDGDWQREQRQKLDREVRVRKGHQTRLKNRIAAGVCPCCHRTFRQLAAHMTSQHPHYAIPETEGLTP